MMVNAIRLKLVTTNAGIAEVGASSNNGFGGSGNSFVDVVLADDERAEFEYHVSGLADVNFGDVLALRKKMFDIKRVLTRLKSTKNKDIFNP